MRHTGRYGYDFSGDEVEFFVGLWYNYLLPFGLSGGTIVIALYVNFWRHARSLPGTNDIQNIP
jgi:hypothetical protein